MRDGEKVYNTDSKGQDFKFQASRHHFLNVAIVIEIKIHKEWKESLYY